MIVPCALPIHLPPISLVFPSLVLGLSELQPILKAVYVTSFSVGKVEHADWLVYYALAPKNKLTACSTSVIPAHN